MVRWFDLAHHRLCLVRWFELACHRHHRPLHFSKAPRRGPRLPMVAFFEHQGPKGGPQNGSLFDRQTVPSSVDTRILPLNLIAHCLQRLRMTEVCLLGKLPPVLGGTLFDRWSCYAIVSVLTRSDPGLFAGLPNGSPSSHDRSAGCGRNLAQC